jgi:hypothetical protein
MVNTRDQNEPNRCPGCLDLDKSVTQHISSRSLILSMEKLLDGQYSGCEICQLLLQSYTGLSKRYEGLELSIVLRPGHPVILTPKLKGAPNPTTSESPPEFEELEIYRTGSINGKLSALPIFADISPVPGSDTLLSFISFNLQKCIQEHPTCGEEFAELPTRLVYVPPAWYNMRIVTTVPSSKGKYVALSHCWGPNTVSRLKLTTANISELSSKIDPACLSPLYKDSILLAQKMGVEYIWIDSLCIVQNDAADWDREAAKMADVYQNAYFTIYTSSCAGPNDSFLAPRTSFWRCGSEAISSTAWPNAPIKARRSPRVGRHTNIDPSMYRERKTDPSRLDPLERRAWAFQEFYLASRLVVFSSEEVQFLCMQNEICECRPTDTAVISPRRDLATDDLSRPKGWSFQGKKPLALWEDLVARYTARQLTFGKDKLPALSGLARRMQGRLQSDYIAGMWKNNLIANMCWEVDREFRTQAAPSEYRAPSFSWVSVDTQIAYPYRWRHTRGQAEVLEIKSILKGQNQFGEVSSCSIVLKGFAAPAYLSTPSTPLGPFDPTNPSWLHWNADRNAEFCRLRFHGSNEACNGRLDTFLEESTVTDTDGSMQRTVRRSSTQQCEIKNAPVLCLRVWLAEDRKFNFQHFCLILGRSKTSGAYERLGLARLFNPEGEVFAKTWTGTITTLV